MQNKFQTNKFPSSTHLPDFLSLHHLSLDTASWLVTSLLLSTQCPTIYVPLSGQSKSFQTKSDHVISLFKTLQRLFSILRIKFQGTYSNWCSLWLSLQPHFHQLFPLSYTPAKVFALAEPSVRCACGLLPMHKHDRLRMAFFGHVSNTASWSFLITFITWFLFPSNTFLTLYYTFIYLLIYLFSCPYYMSFMKAGLVCFFYHCIYPSALKRSCS